MLQSSNNFIMPYSSLKWMLDGDVEANQVHVSQVRHLAHHCTLCIPCCTLHVYILYPQCIMLLLCEYQTSHVPCLGHEVTGSYHSVPCVHHSVPYLCYYVVCAYCSVPCVCHACTILYLQCIDRACIILYTVCTIQ